MLKVTDFTKQIKFSVAGNDEIFWDANAIINSADQMVFFIL